VDFEKAFDTIEWSFIESALEYYGIGPVFQKWIKTFCCDISSAVLNNRHMSEFFTLERGAPKGSFIVLFIYFDFKAFMPCYIKKMIQI